MPWLTGHTLPVLSLFALTLSVLLPLGIGLYLDLSLVDVCLFCFACERNDALSSGTYWSALRILLADMLFVKKGEEVFEARLSNRTIGYLRILKVWCEDCHQKAQWLLLHDVQNVFSRANTCFGTHIHVPTCMLVHQGGTTFTNGIG